MMNTVLLVAAKPQSRGLRLCPWTHRALDLDPLTVQMQHAMSEPNNAEYPDQQPDNEPRTAGDRRAGLSSSWTARGVGTDNERLLRVGQTDQRGKSRINPGCC